MHNYHGFWLKGIDELNTNIFLGRHAVCKICNFKPEKTCRKRMDTLNLSCMGYEDFVGLCWKMLRVTKNCKLLLGS